MTRLPFVDTHVHFHDLAHPRLRYAWLEPDAPVDPEIGPDGAIRARRYWADDFLAETRLQDVRGVVHVQAAIGTADPVEETRWLQAFADRLGLPNGIVAYVDLAADDAVDQVARHRAFPNFRGVRDLRYDRYLDDPVWRRNVAALDGLVLCDDPFTGDMAAMRRLAEAHPGVTICIDHAGFPGYAGRPRRPVAGDNAAWRAGLRELARAPNVVVKLSGLGMSDHAWTIERIRPWALEAIEVFGVDRTVLGTNWPVDRLYSSYGDVLDAYWQLVGDLRPDEQAGLFHANAERIFRLETR